MKELEQFESALKELLPVVKIKEIMFEIGDDKYRRDLMLSGLMLTDYKGSMVELAKSFADRFYDAVGPIPER